MAPGANAKGSRHSMPDKHPDRTTKQPITWRCRNPECAVDGRQFEFQSDYDECPKCKSRPPVTSMISLCHMLLPDPRGRIRGQHGRYRLACARKRDYLATTTNHESASNLIEVVNCPGCLAEVDRLKARGRVGGNELNVKISTPLRGIRR